MSSFWQKLTGQDPDTRHPAPYVDPVPDPEPTPSRPDPGSVWEGPKAYTTDPLIGRPGYYALDETGKNIIDPPILLTHVDDAPGNEEDGSEHYFVAHPDEPYYTHQPAHVDPPRVVSLEAHTRGSSEVSASNG